MRYQVTLCIAFLLVIASAGFSHAQYDPNQTNFGQSSSLESQVTSTPTSRTVSVQQSTTSYYPSSYAASSQTEPRTFWSGTKAASKATWNGIKKGFIWTGKGIAKGAYYTKEGFVAVGRSTGLLRDHELAAHQDIVNLGNKTLVESQTKREIRADQLKRDYIVPAKKNVVVVE